MRDSPHLLIRMGLLCASPCTHKRELFTRHWFTRKRELFSGKRDQFTHRRGECIHKRDIWEWSCGTQSASTDLLCVSFVLFWIVLCVSTQCVPFVYAFVSFVCGIGLFCLKINLFCVSTQCVPFVRENMFSGNIVNRGLLNSFLCEYSQYSFSVWIFTSVFGCLCEYS